MEKCRKNVNIIGFDIFWDILNKMKVNLGQECVKGGFYPCRAHWNNCPGFPWKDDSFSFLTLRFCLSLPKIWLSHPHKNYILSNNRATC